MPMVRVYNKKPFDHVEKFRGQMLTIKSGDFVEMDREDAVLFKSQFFPPKFGKDGLQEVESMKMITIEPIPEEVRKNQAPDVTASNEFVCMACGFTAKSKAGLVSHTKANHAGQMIDDEAREEIMKEA